MQPKELFRQGLCACIEEGISISEILHEVANVWAEYEDDQGLTEEPVQQLLRRPQPLLLPWFN